MALGNDIVKWIAIDRKTMGLSEPIVAHIYVKMNIQEELHSKVWLESKRR